ncbi:MAG TPA: hypothetical protein VKZ96_12895 [Thermomicrobiales bacterium]|nr:hypothetical protein [Thermomicrobiales bacterium]
MTSATTTAQTLIETLTVDDLEAAGFSGEQIARLVETRERYSRFHEFFDERELQRLSFLRWRVEEGHIDAVLGN